MSEQDNEFDVEGHRIAVDGPEDTDGHRLKNIGGDEDTEGHRLKSLEGDEDTEGHRFQTGANIAEDEDDVEGHRFAGVQPPRDTDLGNSPR